MEYHSEEIDEQKISTITVEQLSDSVEMLGYVYHPDTDALGIENFNVYESDEEQYFTLSFDLLGVNTTIVTSNTSDESGWDVLIIFKKGHGTSERYKTYTDEIVRVPEELPLFIERLKEKLWTHAQPLSDRYLYDLRLAELKELFFGNEGS